MLEHLIPFLAASILLTISPGPDIVYVLVQSISNGKRAGVYTSIGLVSGIFIHTSLLAFGVSAIIKESEDLFILIKVLGALYLFFLAYKVWGSSPDIAIKSNIATNSQSWTLYKRGFIMNVINPKVTIFFLAFFPGFLWDPSGNTIYQFYFLGFLFMLQALIIFSMVAFLAGRIANYIKEHPSSGMVLKWVQIFVFIGIGLLILM